ncbi:TonB-dependent receptor [Thalassotalea nanhaiensis]|uniref:TonB-dependent receptor n=1 Tax=Thalassotalea nanhaiensis TaxID=3065648 RepID=A0ABY9TDB0_9GAMM|nr:TonB-dependent receptor [Colwelliaceae bacterium SQ345]
MSSSINNKRHSLGIAIAIALSTSGYSSLSVAEEQTADSNKDIEVILVKGGKRPKTLNEVPASVSVIGGETLAQMKIDNMEDMSKSLPNVSISANAIQDTISIRGINSDLQSGGEQSVGIFVDGVYHGRGVQSRYSFLDVETLEVLRGPQGALFGKNTIGGVLSINPAQPKEDLEAKITTGWETEAEQIETSGFVTGALNDDASLKARLAFKYKDNDKGYMENHVKDETGITSEDLSYRGIFDWQASDALAVNFRLESGEQEANGIYWEMTELTGPLAPVIASFGEDGAVNHKGSGSNMDYPGLGFNGEDTTYYMDTNFDEYALKANYALSAGTFTVMAAQSEYDFVRSVDADFGPLPILQFTDREEFEQTSFEARFVSKDSDTFEYIAGVYYQSSDLLTNGVTEAATAPGTAVGGAFNGAILGMTGGALDIFPEYGLTSRFHQLDQESDMWAVFAQVGIGLTDNLKLELSGRYADEEKDAIQEVDLYGGTGYGQTSGNPLSNPLEQMFWGLAVFEAQPHQNDLNRSESHFTPSASLSWTVNEDTNLYVSYAEGVKGGGFNALAMTADPAAAEYEEEEATSFEIGGKFSLLDGSAKLNVAVFNTKFDDMQTTQFTGGTTFVVANAAEATSQGLELDLVWNLTEDWTLFSNFGYIDFEFDSYENAGCTAMQIVNGGYANGAACSADGGNDLSGKTNQDVPEITAMLGLEYATNLGEFELISRVNLSHSDEYYAAADLDESSKVDAFTLVDASIKLVSPDGDWDVAFIGRNLSDEEYFYYHNDTPLLSGSHQAGTAAPATYTVQFSYHYMN